jgi:hypothetical protein
MSTKVVITGDASGAIKAVERLKTELNGLSALSTKAFSFGGALAGTGVVAGLTAITKSVIDAGDALAKMSVKTGIAVEDLSKLQYAADLSGVSTEQLEKGLVALGQQIAAAGAGNPEAVKRFDDLGVAVRGADGKIKAGIDVFYELADAIAALPEGAAQTNAAIGLFGQKVGKDLVVALAGGSEALKAMGAELESLGGLMSTELAKASEEFNDNIDRLKTLASSAGVSIGNALIPSLNKLLGEFMAAKQAGLGLFDSVAVTGQIAPLEASIDRVKKKLAELNAEKDSGKGRGLLGAITGASVFDDIAKQEKLLKFYEGLRGKEAGQDEDTTAKRIVIAKRLSDTLIKLDQLRGIASGKVSAEVLDDDTKRTAAQIANAEKLRDALKTAWQASIDGARKASEEAASLVSSAANIRKAGVDKAEDIRRSALPEADQAALYQRDYARLSDEAVQTALLAKMAAQQGRLENAARLADEATKTAERAARAGDKLTAPEDRARATERVADAQATAEEARAEAKKREAANLEDVARAQQATIADLDKQITDLQTKAAAVKVQADITQAVGEIATLQAQLNALQDKTVTVTVNTVQTGAEATTADVSLDGFARGGYTGPGGKYQPAGIVHAGEFVVRSEILRQRGALSLLERLNRYGLSAIPGYADGGLVGRLSVPNVQPSEPANARAAATFNFPGMGSYAAELKPYDFDRLQRDFQREALRSGGRR